MSSTTQTLDSKVFFSIPQPEMETDDDYRRWIEDKLIPGWIVEKEGNEAHTCHNTGEWNQEGGIFAEYGKDKVLRWCKLYKIDGNYGFFPRGLLIRDHYSKRDAEKIKLISDSLEEFLKEQKIRYVRQDFYHPY